MKKIFTITTILGLGILISFACKKSSTTTTPASTSSTTGSTTGSTTSSTPTNTTTTNFTIDGTNSTSYSTSSQTFSGSFFVFSANSVSSTGYPIIQLQFPGNTFPASGTYPIVTVTGSAPPAGKCGFTYEGSAALTSAASSGVITITAATTPSNTAVFSAIICSGSAGTHTVTGAVKY